VGDTVRELPREFDRTLPLPFRDPRVFCGGCLVVSGPPAGDEPEAAQWLAREHAVADWPLVVLVDDAPAAVRTPERFLWTTFTRFEPAADVLARSRQVVRNHVAFEPPVVIDARLKPGFPEELFCDPQTAATVTRRWSEYFPGGQEMGDSDAAHLG
jgi:hypothetical protein